MTPATAVAEPRLPEAYAACRAIAKQKAKNFYYAFITLPSTRRNAICAIYAFMRRADDIADDPELSRAERQVRLETWQAEWRAVCGGQPTSDPVMVAVRDAVARFDIPLGLLDQLVAGVALDLRPHADGVPDTYRTFPDLYGYCYLVASVVGLVCIRIFGYEDPDAQHLAEETGIAFQLTNILRDVAEDAGNHRVYLPLEMLAAHGVTLESLLNRSTRTPPTAGERALLDDLAARAENYYQSARRLLPLIKPESRPALWMLVAVYHRLLQRIRASHYDVFQRRASVPFRQKLVILVVGQARMALARLSLSR